MYNIVFALWLNKCRFRFPCCSLHPGTSFCLQYKVSLDVNEAFNEHSSKRKNVGRHGVQEVQEAICIWGVITVDVDAKELVLFALLSKVILCINEFGKKRARNG